jgi:hypothetical protein
VELYISAKDEKSGFGKCWNLGWLNRINDQDSGKIYFIMQSHAIMPLMSGFGSTNRNLPELFPGKEVPKIIFKLRWPGLPHNLS